MKRIFFASGMLVGAIVVALLVVQGMVLAQECRVIRIHGMATHQSIRLEPETILVSKGDCVIWFNRAAAQEVKVVFEDGKKCSSVSEAATGFSLDHENCFVTTWLPFGATSSLRFVQAGRYDYVIEVAGLPAGKKMKGSIVVE